MAWKIKKPEFGDHIRVNRKYYYHHGIYADDNNIIQFGSITGELDPSKARVIITNMKDFLKESENIEVREYNEEELSEKRTPNEIVNYAFMQLGRDGYDLVNNNCEHFANECVFGEKRSEQVDKVKDVLSNIFSKIKNK